jgi:heat shock protein HslJ
VVVVVLRILLGFGALVSLAACVTPKAQGVAGRWELTALDGATVPQEGSREPIHLVLNQDEGTISGFGGVNRFRGSWKVSAERLEVAPLVSTKMAGPLMGLESRFFTVLQSRPVLQREGERLRLWDEGGRCLAEFRAAPK